MRLDEKNKDTRWQDAEILELKQLDKYSTFDDQGKMGKFPLAIRKFEYIWFTISSMMVNTK